MNPTELIFRRRNVKAFIEADPVDVSFVRVSRVRTPAGGWTEATLPPLPPQRARIVPAKRRYGGQQVNTEAGQVDLYPYQLLGFHDMDIAEDDTFSVNGQDYQVKTIEADREERTVAAINYYGAKDNV